MPTDTEIKSLEGYAKMLDALHKQWQPHPGQLAAGRALFYEDKKRIFLNIGRRAGKSSLAAYCAIRWALTRPHSSCYIIGPTLKQIREVMLHAGPLLRICPREFVDSYNATEGRLTLKNGSFVRVLGADEPDSLRGLRISLLVADEVKDLKPDLLDTVMPALLDENSPLILLGTPPSTAEHFFWDLVKEAQSSPEWFYAHASSYTNPYIKKELLDNIRKRYEQRGEMDVFLREFEAIYVAGGKSAIFPMLTDQHVVSYPQLWSRIHKNVMHWNFYSTLDPGTATCFAILVVTINPYRGDVFIMDEVYSQNQEESSIGKVWPQAAAKMKEVYDPDPEDEQWIVTRDSAATWAGAELMDQFGVNSMPTQKHMYRKAEGLSLIKDLLHKKKLLISDRCVNLLKEMRAYMLDKQGNYIKKNDHLIDALRYTLAAAHYTMQESDLPPDRETVPEDEQKRAYTVEQDLMSGHGKDRDLYAFEILDGED